MLDDSNALIRSKLTVMQESVEVYERLGLKSEYLYSYRMLIFLILQAGDFNGLAREFSKFVGDAGLNIEGLSRTERYRTVLTRLWNGQSANDTEREKGIIFRTGEGQIACGMDKVRVFQQCVMPPLKEYYQNAAEAGENIINKVLCKLQTEGIIIGQ